MLTEVRIEPAPDTYNRRSMERTRALVLQVVVAIATAAIRMLVPAFV